MNFEQENKKSEQVNNQEQRFEELSVEKVEEYIADNEQSLKGINQFAKEDLFDGKNFSGEFFAEAKLDDKHDWVAYEKSGFWKKFDDFTGFSKSFSLHKKSNIKNADLIKTKAGTLDKTIIDERLNGQFLPIDESVDKEERKDMEEKFSKELKIDQTDIKERFIDKVYVAIDGKVVKYITSRRTEKGELEAARKMLDEKIKQLEDVDGTELVRQKELFSKQVKGMNDSADVLNLMRPEARKETEEKMANEKKLAEERIAEKNAELEEKLNVFKNPFREKLDKVLIMENNLSQMLNSTKSDEAEVNNKIKEYGAAIKNAQKLNLFGDEQNNIIKDLEEQKNELEMKAKEITNRKTIISSRLDQLKNNKKETEAILKRINKIGKTKEEIAEEEKNKDKDKKEQGPSETKKEGGKTVENDFAEDWSFMGERQKNEREKAKNASNSDAGEEPEQTQEEQESGEEKFYLEADAEEIKKKVNEQLNKLGLNRITKDKKVKLMVFNEIIAKFGKNKDEGIPFTTKSGIKHETKRIFERIKKEYKPK